MKEIMVLMMCATSVSAHAQFQKNELPKETMIGTAKTTGVKFSELSYYVTGDNDTTYHFYYKDKKFTQTNVWKSLYFKGGSQTLNDLYAALKASLGTDKGTEASYTLGESQVLTTVAAIMGAKYLKVGIMTNGVVGLTDLTGKQLDKLFNKTSAQEAEVTEQ